MTTMSKISRGDKGESLVKDELEKINEYHYVFNDVTFENKKSGMTHQIDHILIHPHGVFVIETKNYYGEIIVNNNQWIKIVNNERINISNPLLQNKSHAITLYKILKGEYEIIPVVVFVKNNAPYLPDDNAINLSDLLLFIDSYPYDHKYKKTTIDKIKDKISKRISDVDKKEHVENISYLKQIRKENQDEIRYAIENRKCPRCSSPMINKNNVFMCPHCFFKFKI